MEGTINTITENSIDTLSEQSEVELPIINCHTHTFTSHHVPPWLARTFLPLGLYYLLHAGKVIKVCRFWFRLQDNLAHKPKNQKIKGKIYLLKMKVRRSGMLSVINFLIGLWITVQVFFVITYWFCQPKDDSSDKIVIVRKWLTGHSLLYPLSNVWMNFLFILLLLIFFPTGRNLLFFVFKHIWSMLGALPGPRSKELAKRYLEIGRFTAYEGQAGIFSRLKNQYPLGSRFIILPMDMEFMGAGSLTPEGTYEMQLEELKLLKEKSNECVYPFIAIDPNRIRTERSKWLDYSVLNGTVTLKPCLTKDYIESHGFRGFKIYPAMGYYPFDKELLPLWKYAADNSIPITTHCIRGPIYYRGSKKDEWDRHPIIQQPSGKARNPVTGVEEVTWQHMLMPEIKNSAFIVNFTHPLNFICLLKEPLLREWVATLNDPAIFELFGFIDSNTPLLYNLNHLKICLGHFGGADEWNNFFEHDRDNYASQLFKHPDYGINFLCDDSNPSLERPGKPEQVWRNADWYSIICSMMLQHDNVYADISYIVHDPAIFPLLRETMMNKKLREKVLYGTDFYVVRNHKSDKNMLADSYAGLRKEDFDQIARINPRSFLYNKIHGAIK